MDADALANAASFLLLNVRDGAPEQTFSRLVQLLAASNPRTRLYAAGVVQHYALNYPQVNFASFRPELVRALNDSNDWIRIDVVMALDNAKLGGPELIPALKPGLTNSDPMIRHAAQATMNQLSTTNLVSVRNHAP